MSPQVWGDVRPRIQSVATTLGLTVAWPNEDAYPAEDQTVTPQTWIAIDVDAELAERVELGANTWSEEGTIWIHIMLPVGTGIDVGLDIRKQFSVEFRTAVPTVLGLYYRSQSFDPLGEDNGIWRRLSLLCRYEFTDISV